MLIVKCAFLKRYTQICVKSELNRYIEMEQRIRSKTADITNCFFTSLEQNSTYSG